MKNKQVKTFICVIILSISLLKVSYGYWSEHLKVQANAILGAQIAVMDYQIVESVVVDDENNKAEVSDKELSKEKVPGDKAVEEEVGAVNPDSSTEQTSESNDNSLSDTDMPLEENAISENAISENAISENAVESEANSDVEDKNKLDNKAQNQSEKQSEDQMQALPEVTIPQEQQSNSESMIQEDKNTEEVSQYINDGEISSGSEEQDTQDNEAVEDQIMDDGIDNGTEENVATNMEEVSGTVE